MTVYLPYLVLYFCAVEFTILDDHEISINFERTADDLENALDIEDATFDFKGG